VGGWGSKVKEMWEGKRRGRMGRIERTVRRVGGGDKDREGRVR